MDDSLKQQLDQAMAEFELKRKALIRARDEITAVEVTVSSRDRSIEVTLAADGSPKALRFVDNRHKSMSGQELAAGVLEVFRVAREELAVRVKARFEKATEAVGIDGQRAEDRLNGLGLDRLFDPQWSPGDPLHRSKE